MPYPSLKIKKKDESEGEEELLEVIRRVLDRASLELSDEKSLAGGMCYEK